jgi:hypothetical protein
MNRKLDPKSVFDLACKFAAAEAHLRHKSNPKAGYMASPSMVMSAFTIELFLKCLLLLDGKEFKRIHRLDGLYQKLGRSQKRRIEKAWDKEARPKIIQITKQLGHPSDLPNALVTCGRAFEHMRYGYEDPDRQIFYLGDLPPILWRAIVDIRPEWVSTHKQLSCGAPIASVDGL